MSVGFDTFPRQFQQNVGQRVRVRFRYDYARTIEGRVVRDDAEAPWVTAILLDDNRLVMSTECMYNYIGTCPTTPSPPAMEDAKRN